MKKQQQTTIKQLSNNMTHVQKKQKNSKKYLNNMTLKYIKGY